jgi:hypothetical protein
MPPTTGEYQGDDIVDYGFRRQLVFLLLHRYLESSLSSHQRRCVIAEHLQMSDASVIDDDV